MKDQFVFTREPQVNNGVTSKALLSNQLVGCDNTGNICVWPSESIMLYTLLKNERYTQFIRGKRVLEIGGGLTALMGIGLALSETCNEICITDGHPDCVINQVRFLYNWSFFISYLIVYYQHSIPSVSVLKCRDS